MAEIATNAQQTQDRSKFSALGIGATPYTTNPGDLGIVADECAYGPFHFTRIRLASVRQTITNGASEYTNTLLYTFPVGRIAFLMGTLSLTATTKSATATGFNGGTGAIGIGTVIASNATLSTTMINILPGTGQTPTALTPGSLDATASVTDALVTASTAQFDGTATAIKAYLNTAVAVNSADGTLDWTGYVNIMWLFGGDY